MSQIGLASNGNRPGIILDPRSKLLLLVLLNMVMLGGGIQGAEFYARIILALIPLILVVSAKLYGAGIFYTVILMCAFIGEGIIVQHTAGYVNLIFLFISGIISRFVPGFVLGYYVVRTTTVSEFIAAMEKLHMARKLVIPLSVMFRYFPTIAEENKSIAMAMKMRGISLKGSNPISFLEYRLVPIMMSTVRIGDELSAASLTKGLDSTAKRTNICKIGFHVQDFFFDLTAVLCFLCFVII